MEMDTDARVRLIEASRGAPLPADIRARVLANIAEYDKHKAEGRAFPVPDGTEPGFVFHPVRLASDGPRSDVEDASHG